jgi:ABC-type uncharacterized transport system substrate-binding protein
MRRREFMALLGGTAAAWPLAARAQQATGLPRIGFLSPVPQSYQDQFTRGMRDLGYSVGGNVAIEYRFGGGNDELLVPLAKELTQIPVRAIVATNSAAVAAAIKATSTIPIVMVTTGDPVALGFIASLARPGRNVTGLASLSPETTLKQLELLKEIVPSIRRLVVFWNSLNPIHSTILPQLQSGSDALGVELRKLEIRVPGDFDPALRAAAQIDADAFSVLVDQITIRRRAEFVKFANALGRPTIYALKEFVTDGGLISYGVSFPDLYYRAAGYVDKILKGVAPADLPVQQPVKLELALNLKTAKALGLEVPPTLLVRADEVIE